MREVLLWPSVPRALLPNSWCCWSQEACNAQLVLMFAAIQVWTTHWLWMCLQRVNGWSYEVAVQHVMNALAPSSKNVLWASLRGPTLAVQSWEWYACIWKGNFIVPLNHSRDLFCMLHVFHYRKDRDHLWSCLVSDCSDGNCCMATRVLMTQR